MTTPKQILTNLANLSGALKEDCDSSLELLNKNDGQFERRTMVRILFSFIEGMVYQLKFASMEIHREMSEKIIRDRAEKDIPLLWERFKPTLSWKDISIIEEISPDLDNNGQPKEKAYYPTFIKNLRFAFYVFGKVYHSNFKPNYDDNGWKKLQMAVKIRNRVTHPKNPIDIIISAEDFKTVDEGFKWFQANLSSLFSDFRQTLDALQNECISLFENIGRA